MNALPKPIPSAPADEDSFGGGESGGALAQTKHKISQAARDTAAKVKSATSDTAARARDQAEQIATEKKDAAASRIGEYGEAIHESARSLEEKDPNIAWFTHRAADKLQHVAEYMRNSDWACLRGDCEGIARRHPAAFFGGMFLAGLVIGNVIKASQRRGRDSADEGQRDLDAGEDWSPAAGTTTQPSTEMPAPVQPAGM